MGARTTRAHEAARRTRRARLLAYALVGGAVAVAAGVCVHMLSRETAQEAQVSAPPAPAPTPLTVDALKAEQLRAAEQTLADFPGDPRAIGLLGNVWSSHGNQARAVELWEKALALATKAAAIEPIAANFFVLGAAYARNGDRESRM